MVGRFGRIVSVIYTKFRYVFVVTLGPHQFISWLHIYVRANAFLSLATFTHHAYNHAVDSHVEWWEKPVKVSKTANATIYTVMS